MKLLWLALLVFLPGCYSYVRTPGGPVAGREFSLHLTDVGSSQMAAALGPGALAVQGHVTSVDDQRVELTATGVVRRDKEERWSGETLVIPRTLIASVEERKISAWRSTTFVGAVLLGAFIVRQTLAEVVGDPERGGSSPKPPPGT